MIKFYVTRTHTIE